MGFKITINRQKASSSLDRANPLETKSNVIFNFYFKKRILALLTRDSALETAMSIFLTNERLLFQDILLDPTLYKF